MLSQLRVGLISLTVSCDNKVKEAQRAKYARLRSRSKEDAPDSDSSRRRKKKAKVAGKVEGIPNADVIIQARCLRQELEMRQLRN